jgi:hypothetical protein
MMEKEINVRGCRPAGQCCGKENKKSQRASIYKHHIGA